MPYDDPLTFSTEGEHALWLQGKDALGNDMEEQLIINIDQTIPGIIYRPGWKSCPSRNVSTQVVVTDEPAGSTRMNFFIFGRRTIISWMNQLIGNLLIITIR